MKRAIPIIAVLAVTLAPCELRADAVAPPPDDCPAGSIGNTDHCGEWCQATACTTDADCRRLSARRGGAPQQLSCRQASLCVEHDDYNSCSGWSMGEPRKRVIARNSCQEDADCIRPARCETASRCMPDGTPAPPATSSATPAPSATKGASEGRCGCSLPGAPADPNLRGWLLLGLAASLRRRFTN